MQSWGRMTISEAMFLFSIGGTVYLVVVGIMKAMQFHIRNTFSHGMRIAIEGQPLPIETIATMLDVDLPVFQDFLFCEIPQVLNQAALCDVPVIWLNPTATICHSP